MPRGGKRKGAGQPQKYNYPVEIRIRLERSDRDRLDQYLKSKGISDRNAFLQDLIENKISKLL